MTQTVMIKFQAFPEQQMIINSNARFRILAAGRRWGKSYLASAEAIRFALKEKRQTVWCVSPIYAQTQKLWRIILDMLPYKLIRNVNRSERALELVNGSTIWFKSADNPDSLRGEGIHFLVVDEAASVSREAWEQALRPALSDTRGAVLCISTPKSYGWFFELFQRGQLPEEKGIFESWQFATSDSPYICFSEVEEARRTLPQIVFSQEFEAKFIDSVGSVFRGVNECIRKDSKVGELEEPVQGNEYVVGVDLAKHQDFSVLVVMNAESKHVVAFQRFNELSWEFQKSKILALAKKYNDAKIILDVTGLGDPVYDDLCKSNLNVVAFRFTNESKSQLIESLSIAIEQRLLSFPSIPELVSELHVFSFEVLPSGRMRYCAPGHLHDDCVISLALAWHGAKDYKYVDPDYPAGYPV